MNRGTTPRLLSLVIAALTAALSAESCSRPRSASSLDAGSLQDLGHVGLALILPDGTLVPSVRFVLNTAGGVALRQGDINLGDDHGATVSAVIGAVPAGHGYTVTLSTDLGSAGTCHGVSTPFTVVANETTAVSVLLLCRALTSSGSAIVGGVMDLCPVVAAFSISPLSVAVGATIDVSAVGFDADPADVVAYTWTSTGGTFESPHAPTTRFRCLSLGQHAITITVDDGLVPGSVPPRPRCSASESFPIACTAPAGTGGASGQGGASGTGGGATGGVSGAGGTMGGVIASGGASGAASVPATGGTLGSGGGPASGTDGNFGSGGTAAGGAAASSGATASGGASGAVVLTPGCMACEAGICAVQEPASGGLGCFGLLGSEKTTCELAVACMRASHCAIDGDTSYCYCGTANQDDGSCASAPLGPCVAALEAADPRILPTDSQGTRFAKVAMDLVDPTLPIGKATGLISCDAFSCNTTATCAGQF